MTCIQGIPTEVKARRIVQCPGDLPLNVNVIGQVEFDHTILCEFDGTELTGEKVVAIISYGANGAPVFSYYDLSDGSEYTLPEGYTLTVCGGTASSTDVEMQQMCDGGTTTFLRWFIVENGSPTGGSVDTDFSGLPYEATGIVTGGVCGMPEEFIPNAAEFNGPILATGLPTYVKSITITAKSGSVYVSFDEMLTFITIPEGGSFTWGTGDGYLDVTNIQVNGTGDANYIVHWEALPLA